MTLRCPACDTCIPYSGVLDDSRFPLTKKQRAMLDFLDTYNDAHGYMPNFVEIAAQFNLNSLATVHEHLGNLERKGYIVRQYNCARAITLVHATQPAN